MCNGVLTTGHLATSTPSIDEKGSRRVCVRPRETARRERGTKKRTEKQMNLRSLQSDGGEEGTRRRKRAEDEKRERTNNERRGTRGEKALVQACLVS